MRKTFLCIIPARGGSKRLPNKNIMNLSGKPLIAWTIEAALKCKYIDKVIVSTDDNRIANVAKNFGAVIPFVRPEKLASDSAKSEDAILHAINHYKENKKEYFDYIVLLQPTSPLRDSIEIENSIQLLDSKNADAIVSLCKVEHSPLWMNTLPDDLSMDSFIQKEVKGKRSQDLPQYYQLNGAIYICKTEIFLKGKTFFLNKNIYAYIMTMNKSIDIDSIIDFRLAEYILTETQNKDS